MTMVMDTTHLDAYLQASEVVDFNERSIQAIAAQLLDSTTTDIDRARTAYEFVRDQISHSFDINGRVVTCRASEVLQHREGICFAKSHLLAAILRCLHIPTGFCYQKLILDDADPTRFTLHGFNAIYLESLDRWIRVDARGQKPGVHTEFCLDGEQLAYPTRTDLNEREYPEIFAHPNPNVIAALEGSTTLEQLMANLPPDV